MNRFYYTYNRYCNVALAAIAFILVCLIDAKAQPINETDFLMNSSTVIPTEATVTSLETIASSQTIDERPFDNTFNQTKQQDRTITMKMSTITTTASMTTTVNPLLLKVSTSLPETLAQKMATELFTTATTTQKPIPSSVLISESNSITNAQPLVMTSSSDITTSTPLSLLLTTKANVVVTTVTSTDRFTADSSTVVNENNEKSSSDEESNLISSTLKTTTFRPFIVPTLPTLRPRIIHQRPYSKHHHDHHWGPFFEEPVNATSGALQVGFHLGTEAILNCRVGMLKDKTVMWIQRTVDKVSLLTVGNVTYSGDPRIGVKFQYPNNWRLHVNPIRQEDAGLYMCQVSTHPPKVFATNLTVLAPAIRVVDEMGHDVNDRYYKLGSLIDISCQVAVSYLATLPPVPSEHLKSKTAGGVNVIENSDNNRKDIDTGVASKVMKDRGMHYLNHKIEWKKDGEALPGDIKISLSTSKNWKNSRLTILHAYQSHSGIYSCSVYNTSTAAAHVQVLNGETPAAVQHNAGCGIFVADAIPNAQIKFLSVSLLLFTIFHSSRATLSTTRILVAISETITEIV